MSIAKTRLMMSSKVRIQPKITAAQEALLRAMMKKSGYPIGVMVGVLIEAQAHAVLGSKEVRRITAIANKGEQE